MNWKKIRFIFPLVVVVISVYLILAQPEILGHLVFKNIQIPAGTLISWLGLFAYTLLFYYLFPSTKKTGFIKVSKAIMLIDVLLAACWGFISALLAGNWAFSFQNSPLLFKVWIGITLIIILIPLIVWLVFLLSGMFRNINRNTQLLKGE